MREYLQLAKPGIVIGNAITAAAGFLFASRYSFDLGSFAATIAGLSLVVASACVFNNYLDRKIDAHMKRTNKRALVSGVISSKVALLYGGVLGLSGIGLLLIGANKLTALIAVVGFVFYVAVYGFAKRKSVYGTLVGSISGAIPPVVGYVAVINEIDRTAWLLFFILVCWQMPHFYAIALYRMEEYKAAKLPVLPVVKGIASTRRQIVVFITLFVFATTSLWSLSFASLWYVVIMAMIGAWWLESALDKSNTDINVWARSVFKNSLVVLLAFCVLISVDGILA